jgi:predicted transcriptional regulator
MTNETLQILKLLIRRGSAGAAEVALALDVQNASNKLSAIKKLGLIEHYNEGGFTVWTITPKGKAAIPRGGMITPPITYRPTEPYVPPGFVNYRESAALRCPSVGLPT